VLGAADPLLLLQVLQQLVLCAWPVGIVLQLAHINLALLLLLLPHTLLLQLNLLCLLNTHRHSCMLAGTCGAQTDRAAVRRACMWRRRRTHHSRGISPRSRSSSSSCCRCGGTGACCPQPGSVPGVP
jgi:hypothetical protein